MSWAKLDAEIKANHAVAPLVAIEARSAPEGRTDPVVPLRPGAAAPRTLLSDWTRVLDSINEAGARAEEREKRLAAQAAAHHQTLTDLRAELQQAREEARTTAAHAQAQLADAEERLRAAKERAAAAETRADHAEMWLARIADAVGTLLVAETSAPGAAAVRNPGA